jgi:arylsulfatase
MKKLFGPITLMVTISTAYAQTTAKRPNIIFLQADQQRWDYLGKLNPQVKTPNLDKVAAEGIIYDQAVCQAPMCVPSRYSLMTGLYASQVGILKNGEGLTDAQMPGKTIAELLQQAGYQTAGFGKTHWSSKNCSTRGFDVRAIPHERGSIHEEQGALMMTDNNKEGLERYNEEVKNYGSGEERPEGYVGRTSAVNEEDHRDGWSLKECLSFIDSGIDKRKPLFLYLSFLKPHAANNIPKGYESLYNIDDIQVPEQPALSMVEPCHATGINRETMYRNFWSKADPLQWKEMILRYRANCSWIDNMFGRVLEKLKAKGILDNCLIIFVSDHGEMLGERYYRFNKYCLFESSVRVPMILGGTVIPKSSRGTVNHQPAELVDVLPTILKVAGISDKQPRPGVDLLSKSVKTAGFCEMHERKDTSSFMWRTPGFKLILTAKNNVTGEVSPSDIVMGELYDLKNDEREWHNLYNSLPYAQTRSLMTGQLLKYIKEKVKLNPEK